MGAGNVKLVYARWPDLGDAPLRLLAYMAVIALDEGEQPRFWGGREALALAIGRMVPDRRTEDRAELAERRLAFKAVTRTLGALKDAGAITLLSAAAPGRNAVYALNLAARRVPLSGSHSTAERVPPSGGHSDPETPPNDAADDLNGSRFVGAMDPTQRTNGPQLLAPMDPTQRDPEEYVGVLGLNQGGDAAGVTTDLTGPRATAAPPTPDLPKCSHKVRVRRPTRADGRPACALCRVEQDRTNGVTRPGGWRAPDPPPDPARLAPVIDLRTREAQ